MEQIQFVDVNKLSGIEQSTVKAISAAYYDKIQRELKNITSVVLQVKTHNHSGSKKKFSTHARVVAPTRMFEASAADWDLARTLHKLFKELEREIQHKLHTDEQKGRK